MPTSPTHSQSATAVAGGTGTQPTPANNVGGGDDGGWGDRIFRKGGQDDVLNQGTGHVPPKAANETMGSFLGLRDQKTRAENKYLERVDLASDGMKPMTDSGEPTCATEDHSFMSHKPGGSETMPGWGTMKNVFGR
ncbi:hypothetical protein N7532_008738 [Penicillium argentinense]|uniref:Uncharacterized protein n=1 Tax=Penicillium argentinense TaxID=1131581 RepID=A0A9W9EY62_9EURO|nr:uncharacterized protein N7532_008738 [Penicillium argentinense]KAJ5090054.1 hypothetical protein N7532_008738 [Penicillium argentinense]